MKKTNLVCLLGLLCILAACSKKQDINSDPAYGKIPIPYGNDSLMPTYTTLLINNVMTGVSGVLIANKQTRILSDTAGNVTQYDSRWQQAIFIDSTGYPGGDAGNVMLNSQALIYSGGYFQYWNNDQALWDNNGSNTWEVSGNSIIPQVNYTVNNTFPEFTGDLPDTVSVSSSFSYTFNSADFQNTDSVYAILYCGPGAHLFQSARVGVNGETVTLNFPDPIAFVPENLWFSVRENLYFGGLLEIVCIKYDRQQFSGKSFAFIKQREVLKKIFFH